MNVNLIVGALVMAGFGLMSGCKPIRTNSTPAPAHAGAIDDKNSSKICANISVCMDEYDQVRATHGDELRLGLSSSTWHAQYSLIVSSLEQLQPDMTLGSERALSLRGHSPKGQSRGNSPDADGVLKGAGAKHAPSPRRASAADTEVDAADVAVHRDDVAAIRAQRTQEVQQQTAGAFNRGMARLKFGEPKIATHVYSYFYAHPGFRRAEVMPDGTLTPNPTRRVLASRRSGAIEPLPPTRRGTSPPLWLITGDGDLVVGEEIDGGHGMIGHGSLLARSNQTVFIAGEIGASQSGRRFVNILSGRYGRWDERAMQADTIGQKMDAVRAAFRLAGYDVDVAPFQAAQQD